MGQKRKMLNN